MNYRSYGDLSRTIRNNLHKFPHDIDLVVGIPRSGLLVANMLATYRELPLVDLEGFLNGRIFDAGRTRMPQIQKRSFDDIRKVLVIDDSVFSGDTLKVVKDKIATTRIDKEYVYATVYITPATIDLVDIYLEIVPSPRMFEWNFMHKTSLRHACIDIDGVLCRDPLPEENDDSERYLDFLKNVEPFLIPRVQVGNLVTCRLEKYRQETEAWLAKNGVDYVNLFMMQYETKEERVRAGSHAQFKAQIFDRTGSSLFIESSWRQAREIAIRTGKPVFCVETNEMMPTSIKIVEDSTELWLAGVRNVRQYPKRAIRKIATRLGITRLLYRIRSTKLQSKL